LNDAVREFCSGCDWVIAKQMSVDNLAAIEAVKVKINKLNNYKMLLQKLTDGS
jgi:hypothetical protein